MAELNSMPPRRTLRAAVNSPYSNVVAVVATLSAAGGAAAGGVAALISAAVLTPRSPVTGLQVAGMAVGYGVLAGVAGAVLGTLVGFGALRRVPLGRLALCTNLGLCAGLTTGFLGGPWAWHHMDWLGLAGFAGGAHRGGSTLARDARAALPPIPRIETPQRQACKCHRGATRDVGGREANAGRPPGRA